MALVMGSWASAGYWLLPRFALVLANGENKEQKGAAAVPGGYCRAFPFSVLHGGIAPGSLSPISSETSPRDRGVAGGLAESSGTEAKPAIMSRRQRTRCNCLTGPAPTRRSTRRSAPASSARLPPGWSKPAGSPSPREERLVLSPIPSPRVPERARSCRAGPWWSRSSASAAARRG